MHANGQGRSLFKKGMKMTKSIKAKATINTEPPLTTINNDHALTVIDPNQDIKAHSTKIKGSWQRAVSSIIETGQFLIDAKNALPHGRFSKLFDKEIGNLPFGKDTAQRLMKIAGNKVLSNTAYTPLLPASWMTLVILSRATDEQLEGWLADGSVHAELEQLDALALVNPVVLPAPGKDVPNESAEAVQIQMELGGKAADKLQKNESAMQQLDQKADVQLLKNIADRLHDPDWNKVIAFAGEAKVRDIIIELQNRLDAYQQANANAAAKAAFTVH
jgi:hypothetical protein